ncbi:MAG: hypothetical protein M3494_18155 [Actinomycetota bacterium]|nr:hypothetical protein [Rubrobacter sp.]MDQ3509898.1 hypothetical protein [Actinomycetota bacterium]
MSGATALGILLVLGGLGGLGFGLFALLRGGRGQSGGIGPIPERWMHVFAGVRMLVFGIVCLAAGGYFLYSSLG